MNLLPFGVIVLDGQGTILQYNSSESMMSGYDATTVVGRGFFTDVAPCTNVKEFAGRVHELQSRGVDAREPFEFVFTFKSGSMMVEIVCLYESSSMRTTLLVSKMP